MPQRDDVLSDEFVRAQPEGLRPFSVGILKLCRKLGLAFALPASAAKGLSQETLERQTLAMVWLLDVRHPLPKIQLAAEAGWDALQQELAEYEFRVEPALYAAAKAELDRTNKALSQALVHVQPQPGEKSPTPPGN